MGTGAREPDAAASFVSSCVQPLLNHHAVSREHQQEDEHDEGDHDFRKTFVTAPNRRQSLQQE